MPLHVPVVFSTKPWRWNIFSRIMESSTSSSSDEPYQRYLHVHNVSVWLKYCKCGNNSFTHLSNMYPQDLSNKLHVHSASDVNWTELLVITHRNTDNDARDGRETSIVSWNSVWQMYRYKHVRVQCTHVRLKDPLPCNVDVIVEKTSDDKRV